MAAIAFGLALAYRLEQEVRPRPRQRCCCAVAVCGCACRAADMPLAAGRARFSGLALLSLLSQMLLIGTALSGLLAPPGLVQQPGGGVLLWPSAQPRLVGGRRRQHRHPGFLLLHGRHARVAADRRLPGVKTHLVCNN